MLIVVVSLLDTSCQLSVVAGMLLVIIVFFVIIRSQNIYTG